jgi:hypothetical protein
MVVMVMPSRVIETSLTTVFDEEPLPPDALLLPEEDDAEEVDDVASVEDVDEIEDVDEDVDDVPELDWVELGVIIELTELIDMVMPA